jgi:DNA-binding LacI/PurR family transcriptional regulator
VARVRLADIAERVGVSTKTVSNVVNGTGWVGDEVRARVLEVIDELGYRPNLAARQLRNGRSGLVGFVVPDLREPYFAEFVSLFVDSAQRRSLTVLVAQTGGNRDNELAMIEGEGMPALDGLVMSPLALRREDIEGRRSTMPLVLAGEEAESLVVEGVHHVGVDNQSAAAAATTHLISQGRRRIAAIGVQHDGPTATSRVRFEGYKQALQAHGIPFDDRLLGGVDHFNRAEGSTAVARLLDEGVDFDGLFCFSDSLAFGALHTLAARGIAIPRQVEVIGFDDIEEGKFLFPSFSTINPGVNEASEKILDILTKSDDTQWGHQSVPFRLVVR